MGKLVSGKRLSGCLHPQRWGSVLWDSEPRDKIEVLEKGGQGHKWANCGLARKSKYEKKKNLGDQKSYKGVSVGR